MIYAILIIIALLMLIMVIWVSVINDDKMRTLIGIITGTILLIFIGILGDLNYKEGQIDALKGKIKYELKTNSDSTRTWICTEDKDE